ncbi:MAG TPA: ECF-type sigma factor [Acetobacteraceae bacterium]|nr:ECF-type sigma factor [Acetobacteraceae bacterium]
MWGSALVVRMQEPGNAAAIDALWSGLYPDLKQLARSRLRRSGQNTLLDTTGLVNDAYLRVAGAAALREASPGQFLAYAARTMRSVVIDLARERQALRRGGDLARMTLNTAVVDAVAAEDEPLQIDEALQELAKVEPRLSQVVEMRYFGGFTEAEIGAALGVTERTVRRDWEKARLLLRAMLGP